MYFFCRGEKKLREGKLFWRQNSSFVSIHTNLQWYLFLLAFLDCCCNTAVYFFTLFCNVLGDPHNDPNAQGDAFKTLFVARVVSMFTVTVAPLYTEYYGNWQNVCSLLGSSVVVFLKQQFTTICSLYCISHRIGPLALSKMNKNVTLVEFEGLVASMQQIT